MNERKEEEDENEIRMKNRLCEHLNKQYADKENQTKINSKPEINIQIEREREQQKEKSRSEFC